MADVHIGFLDEVFNSNSGCLNATLNIINEKKILNGTRLTEVPLMMLVGASNSLPAETTGELSAFYDRFLLREEKAKAIAIKVLEQARLSRRDCIVILFGDHETIETIRCLKGFYGESDILNILLTFLAPGLQILTGLWKR